MSIGLHGFSETMSGTWTPVDGSGRRVLSFSVDADATSAVDYLKDGAMQLAGTMRAEGLAAKAPTEGRIEVQPLRRRIAYFLEFTGDDGKLYRFAGEKHLSVFRPLKSATTLPGEITDRHGALVGRALVRFDLRRDLVSFLRTFRPARSEAHQLSPKTT
jgi:hypothetical protein